MLKQMKEKKKRSKSCIQRSDNIFSGPHSTKATNKAEHIAIQGILKKNKDRDMSQEALSNKRNIASNAMDKLKKSKHPARDKNCVIELSLLKREVDNEIRRDRKMGRLEIAPSTTMAVNHSLILKSASQEGNRSHSRKSANLNKPLTSTSAN